ncbi:MAG: hypothetical protein GZ091_11470 [Paludibacter sp.]|nr:hypothetical protein [Paludibacter sp.]
MYTNYQNTSSTIRFRRWSRAGYAVFCSLGNNVTIGCLDIATSDKSLQKSVSNANNKVSSCYTDVESEESNIEKSELKLTKFQLLQTMLSEITFDSAAACEIHLYTFIIHHSG